MTVNCIVQARLNSTRLPRKVLLPIDGITIIERICREVMKAGLISLGIVAIPEKDDELAAIIPDDMKIVRGPENDVAARFARALQAYPCEAFVRVCADSPFIRSGQINACARLIHSIQPQAYCLLSYGPSGLQVEGFNSAAFLTAEPLMIGSAREHLGEWWSARKMSIDTAEDYERLLQDHERS